MKTEKLIKRVDIAFAGINPQQRAENRFATKVRLSDEDFIVLRGVFINHERIDSFIKETVQKNPNLTSEEVMAKTQQYISKENLHPNINSCWYNSVHKIHDLNKKGTLHKDNPIKYLSLTASKLQNDNFTVTAKNDKIMLEGINVILMMNARLPENIIDDKFFYMNISTSNIERLESLQVSFHAPK